MQEFVRSTLHTTLDRVDTAPWTHIEVALWLLFQLGEGLPDAVRSLFIAGGVYL